MKVVFLDIDGVLNTCDGLETGINRSLVEHLNLLIRETGASIVVSSSWRIAGLRRIREILREHGFVGRVAGITPLTSLGVRGLEIQAWLDNCRWPVTGLVILDDTEDMAHLHPHLIRTDYRRGLTVHDVTAAVDRLRVAFPFERAQAPELQAVAAQIIGAESLDSEVIERPVLQARVAAALGV